MLQIKCIIDTKGENIMKMNEEKTKLIDFENCLLKERKQDENLQNEIEFLIQHINKTFKRLNEYKTENTAAKTFLQKQNKECEKMGETMLEQISNAHESISKCEKEIKTLEKKTESYEQQKHEYEFFKKYFEEGKYDNIITEVNKECPICYKKMGPSSKKYFSVQKGIYFVKNVSQKFEIQREYVHMLIKILSQTQLETKRWRKSLNTKLEGKILIQIKAEDNLRI